MYALVSDAWFTFVLTDPPKSRRAKVSKSGIMHHVSSWLSNVLCSSKMTFQIASKCVQQLPSLFSHFQGKDGLRHALLITTCTDFLIAVSNIFSNSHRMHTYSVLVFIISLHFQIVLNTVGMHYLPSLF